MGLHLLEPQAPLQGLLVRRRLKAGGGPAIGLRMAARSASLRRLRLLRQAWPGLPDGIQEQYGLAIGMRVSSQQAVDMLGQDVATVDRVEERKPVGALAPHLDIRG